LRRKAFVEFGGVLSKSHIMDIMNAILNGPMAACKAKKVFSSGLGRFKSSDKINGFPVL